LLGGETLGYPWSNLEGIFTPSSVLAEYWEFTPYSDENAFWGASYGVYYSKQHVQQYSDYAQSRHFELQFGCWTCHDPHTPEPSEPVTTAQANAACYTCHSDRQPPNLSAHTKHGETSPASRCVNCHMTRTGMTATPWDMANHTFVPIPPSETILMLDEGSPNPIINSCMATDICHGGPSALTDREALVTKQGQYDSFYGGG
jgi:predicted CXXCH cytochrome family protein